MIANGDVSAGYETKSGDTALLAAVSAHDADAVTKLIMWYVEMQSMRLGGRGWLDDIFALIRSGVSVDCSNKHGYTPLMKAIAAATPSSEISPAIIPEKHKRSLKPSSKYAVSAIHGERSPITFNNRMIECVLQYNPDLALCDTTGKTAYDWARLTGNDDAMSMLEVKQRKESLHNANQLSRQQRVAECWDLLARHEHYVVAIETMLACTQFNEAELVAFLKGTTISLEEFTNTVDDLQRADADQLKKTPHRLTYFVNTETRDGWTPLIKSAALGYLAAVQELLDMGAILHHETRLKHTAMTWACYCGHEGVVLHLIRAGVDVNRSTREGKTALMHAVSNAQPKIVHHLLVAMRSAALPESPIDSFVNSSKRSLCEDGLTEWHETFLLWVNVRDSVGNKALDYAEKNVAMSDDMDDNPSKVLQELQSAISDADAHRSYVAVHRDRTAPTRCIREGCSFIGPMDTMMTHEEHHCLKRTVTCDHCSQQYVFEDKQQHETRWCDQRYVACPNLQFGCRESTRVRDREQHASFHCRKRQVECRRLCGASMCFDQLDNHETAQCSLRSVSCDQGCGAEFLAKDAKLHHRKKCVKRLVECTGTATKSGGHLPGCGQLVKFEDMDFHVSTLCGMRKRSCKWAAHGCDALIGGAAEAREHHEENECAFRLVACRNGCKLSGTFLALFADEHYAWQCTLEMTPCPNGCRGSGVGADILTLPQHLAAVHCLVDAGDCALRQTHCPLDLCGKSVQLYDSNIDKITTLMTADPDQARDQHRSISLNGFRARVDKCSRVLDQLERWTAGSVGKVDVKYLQHVETRDTMITWLRAQCEQMQTDIAALEREKLASSTCTTVLSFDVERGVHFVQYPDGHNEWCSLECREYTLLDILGAKEQSDSVIASLCGLIPAQSRLHHVENECSHRLVPCPLKCGQRLPFNTVSVHVAKRCNLRNASCRLGCGEILPFARLVEHEEAQCKLRSIVCQHCRVALAANALVTHLSSTCQDLPRGCRLGCTQLVAWRDVPAHEATVCPKRLIQCGQCEQLVWVADKNVHDRDECPLRTFGPCEAGCGRVLRHNDVTHHLLVECPQRMVNCSFCGERVVFATLAQHKALACPQRLVFCRKGCGQQLKDADADAHENGECSRRQTMCPNQCGLHVAFFQLDEHLQYSCTMRVVECPLGCRERVFAYMAEDHWKRCRQRVVPCGTGAKQCGRPIRLWVAGRRLERCSLHHENALLYAIKTCDHDLTTYFLQNVDDAATQVNDEFANGFAPLVLAASLGDLDLIKLLLRFGADVNFETSRGRTPLSEASLAPDPAAVALLLEHRADVFHTNRMGRNILATARALVLTVTTSVAPNVMAPQYQRVLELLEEQAALERDHRALFVAIACSDYDWATQCVKHGHRATGNESGDPQTELDRVLREQQALSAQVKSELEDAVRVFNESVADTEAKSITASQLLAQVHDCERQIARVEQSQEASEAASGALEVDMLSLIREITAQDVAALLNLHVPPEGVLVVMKAICLMCGVVPRGRRDATEYSDMEWWKTAQALLMDRSLLRRLRGYRKHPVAADVMAKVRRECLRSPAFSACTEEFDARGAARTLDTSTATTGRRPSTATASSTAVRPGLVNTLAAWVKGVESEYRSQSERQVFVDRKRKMAVALNGTQATLTQAKFAVDVAVRSLPSRQEEVDAARALVQAADAELAVARDRVRVHRLLGFTSLTGHTPLSFAAAVGNEAMVRLLLAHGAVAGVSHEEKTLCASLVQAVFRDYRYRKQRRGDDRVADRSDAAMAALVSNVAHAFLLGHYRRKLALFRQTHRVPLHEAIFNGFPDVAAVLVSHDAGVAHKTHVLPGRVFPCAPLPSDTTDWLDKDAAERVYRSEGWILQPLARSKQFKTSKSPGDDEDVEWEPDGGPMTLGMTLLVAQRHYDCRAYSRQRGWESEDVTFYSPTQHYANIELAKGAAAMARRREEVLAKKNVSKKTAEQRVLHTALAAAIIARDFVAAVALLNQGAFADYETPSSGTTLLMAACVNEFAYMANSDGVDVLVIELLLSRTSNRPAVNFESSTGRTALTMSARYGTRKCAAVLLSHGARVNLATRRDGRTALMVAAASGQPEMVKLLLDVPETDVLIRDTSGRSALDWAREVRCDAAVAMLSRAVSGNRGRLALATDHNGVVSAIHGVCKWGCGFLAPREAHDVDHGVVIRETSPLQDHETKSCPKRLMPCPHGCHRDNGHEHILLAEDVDAHLNLDCPLHIIECTQTKCGQSFLRRDAARHAQSECDFRLEKCACGEVMTHQKLVAHAQSTCPERLVVCSLGCNPGKAVVRLGDLKRHELSECPRRRVRCRLGCGANALLARDRDIHEADECAMRRVKCRWNCEDVVLAREQAVHEREECEQREVECPARCGVHCVIGVPLDAHLRVECVQRLVVCPLKCGRRIPLASLENHQANDCNRRRVTCLRCKMEVVEMDRAAHDARECSLRLSTCGLCGQAKVAASDMTRHRAEDCKMRLVECVHGCKTATLRAVDQPRHEQSECKLRRIWCPLGCGVVFPAHTLRQHEKDVCPMRFTVCELGCGAEMRDKDRADHELVHCPLLRRR